MIILTLDMDNGLVMPDNRVLAFCRSVVDDMLLEGGEVRLTVGSAILVDGFRLALLEHDAAEKMVIVVAGKEWPTSKYGNNEVLTSSCMVDMHVDLVTDIVMLQTKMIRQAKGLA